MTCCFFTLACVNSLGIFRLTDPPGLQLIMSCSRKETVRFPLPPPELDHQADVSLSFPLFVFPSPVPSSSRRQRRDLYCSFLCFLSRLRLFPSVQLRTCQLIACPDLYLTLLACLSDAGRLWRRGQRLWPCADAGGARCRGHRSAFQMVMTL
jgi:hypothetical protein